MINDLYMRHKHFQYKGLIGFQVDLNHNQSYKKQQLTQDTDFFKRSSRVFFDASAIQIWGNLIEH